MTESESSTPVESTPESVNEPEPVAGAQMYYFFDPECPTCKAQEPIVLELIAEGIPIVLMNIIDNPRYIGEYNITYVPTFILNGISVSAYYTKEELLDFYNTNK